MRSFILSIAMLLFLPLAAAAGDTIVGVGPGGYAGISVIELYINGGPYRGGISFDRRRPLSRGGYARGGYTALYIAEVMPGEEYTLGLAYPASKNRFRVTLFDRWPHLKKARRVELPMGPTLRTSRERVEYRWRVGVSPRSTSTLMYIMVETKPVDLALKWLPHTVFITTPPVTPSSTVGRGVTYLQGPRKLVLAGEGDNVSYVIETPKPTVDPSRFPKRRIPGDMVRNGWFSEGLNYWKPHVGYGPSGDWSSFSLKDGDLSIFGMKNGERAGFMQIIDADVSDADSLVLRADVKVDKQTLGGTGPDGRTAPIALSVCYEDVDGAEHCGDQAFWKGFYTLPPEGKGKTVNGQKVPEGLWYRYMGDLMDLEPKPRIIKYISIEGSGWPERAASVRSVHLIKRKAEK